MGSILQLGVGKPGPGGPASSALIKPTIEVISHYNVHTLCVCAENNF